MIRRWERDGGQIRRNNKRRVGIVFGGRRRGSERI